MREIGFRCYWNGKMFYDIAIDNKGKPMFYDKADGPLSGSFEVAHWEKFADNPVVMQYTGLKDKNGRGLTEVYEYDIISESGEVIGNLYETQPGKSDIIVPQIGTKTWETTYKEIVARGFNYPE